MYRLTFALLSLAIALPSVAQKKPDADRAEKPREVAAPTESGARLPVKRVVLYKNGVGYFEHSARVHGNQELTIDFTTAQLNDVLKSLTVVDLGEGRISGVRYNSIAPLEERLKSRLLASRLRRPTFFPPCGAPGSRCTADRPPPPGNC